MSQSPVLMRRTISRFFYSLRSRLFFFVLLLLVPIFIFVWLSVSELRQIRAMEAQQTALRFARLAASTQAQQIAASRQLLSALVALPFVHNGDEESCNAYLASLLEKHPQYTNISAVALDGTTFLCSGVEPLEGVNVTDRAWFQRVVETHEFAVGDYIVTRTTNAPSISFAYPIDNASGEFIGVAVVSTHLDWLSGWLGQIDLPPNSTLRMLDSNGIILAAYPFDEGLIGEPIRAQGLLQTILAQREGTMETPGADGQERFYGFTTLSEMVGDVYAVVGISKAIALAQENRLQLVLTVIMLLGIAGLLLLGWFGASRLIIRPIGALIRATERLAQGDLTTRTDLPKGVKELDRLAHSIDTLAEALSRREAQLRESMEQLAVETDARRAAEAADELKLRFLAMISHELRTPLTSIKGFSSTLLADDIVFEPQQQRDFISVIDEEADKLSELVDQLLDVSRLQAGTLNIQQEACRFSDIVRVATAQLRSLAQNHTLVIESSDLAPSLLADRQRIAQVLVNLVGNAAKYSPPGTIIRVRVRHLDGHMQIDVIDEGMGISEHDRQHVFEAFYQIERKLGKRSGVGLGLAICKGLVESHGGRIWIQPQQKTGTTISFTLPVASAR